MKTTRFSLLVLAIIYFVSCNKTANYDSNKIAIFKYKENSEWPFKSAKPYELRDSDFRIIEDVLKKSMYVWNIEQANVYKLKCDSFPNQHFYLSNFNINLNNYNRQYIAVINSKGEKEVWINCICNTDKNDWKKEIVLVDDGGNCYWQIIINITKKVSYDLFVNDNIAIENK
jgi:hypothetical protein